MITRPMLAASIRPEKGETLERLRYPLLASPKLDGIRLLCHPERGPVTRKFIPVPNRYLREILSHEMYKGLDGEIMMMDSSGKPLPFNPIQSAVTTHEGQPQIQYWVFDYFAHPDEDFRSRYTALTCSEWDKDEDPYGIIRVVEHLEVGGPDEVRELAAKWIEEGFEGLVLRDPYKPYKSGRSTFKEQGMVKYKEFTDAEGVIVDFEELLRNQNEQERDEFGLAKRSTEKVGMVPAGTLGALILQTKWGVLRVGSGFDAALREHIWNNRGTYLGRTVTFKYQPHGMQDLPRFPIFLRFRED